MTVATETCHRAFRFGRQHLNRLLIAGLSLTAVSTAGCVATAVGIASITSIDVASDRRTAGNFFDDNKVEIKIATKVELDDSLRQGKAHISVTAINGIVLLTGEAPSRARRQRAVQIASSYPEASKVINQIRVAQSSDLSSRTQDAWLTSKVKTSMLAANKLAATHIKVVTEATVVYLMGLVTRAEGNAAATAATTVSGITRVVKVFEYISAR